MGEDGLFSHGWVGRVGSLWRSSPSPSPSYLPGTCRRALSFMGPMETDRPQGAFLGVPDPGGRPDPSLGDLEMASGDPGFIPFPILFPFVPLEGWVTMPCMEAGRGMLGGWWVVVVVLTLSCHASFLHTAFRLIHEAAVCPG